MDEVDRVDVVDFMDAREEGKDCNTHFFLARLSTKSTSSILLPGRAPLFFCLNLNNRLAKISPSIFSKRDVMKEFIAYLVKNLVDKPDAVDIQMNDVPECITVEIRVAPEDIAKVVGRQGRTIKSLRTIAMTVGARLGRRVRLEVID